VAQVTNGEGTAVEQSTYRKERLEKLDALIKNIRIAMLTTVEQDGSLRSRPMVALPVAFEGELWFFTSVDASKVTESQQHQQINVSFADPEHQDYVSMSGTASFVRDRQRMEELWSPRFSRWFPKGLEEPSLALLKVNVETAEYWDAPSSTMVNLYKGLKATLTGKGAEAGEHAKLVVDERQAGT
jgi:general stress protein 26